MAMLSNLLKFIPGVKGLVQSESQRRVNAFADSALSSDESRRWREEEFKPENLTDLMVLFEKHIAYFTTVEAKARAVSQLPLRLYTLDKKGQHIGEITNGRIYDVINRPNINQTYSEFMEAIVSYYCLVGNAFIEKTSAVLPKEMYVLRPDFVEITTSAKKLVVNYVYKPDGCPQATLTPDLVIHLKSFHPRSELYGLSPVSPSLQSAILDFHAIKFQKNFFIQGGMVDKYVTTGKDLGAEEFKRFKTQVQDMINGVRNAHKVPVFDNGGKIDAVNTDVKNLMLKEQRDDNRNSILSGSGVPPIMANLVSDAATYNNVDAQQSTFWTNTIKPLCKRIQDKFNMDLFWPIGVECAFDFADVKVLQDDQLKKAQTAQSVVISGIMTPDEARAKFYDMKPLPSDYRPPMAGNTFATVPSAAPPLGVTPADTKPDKTAPETQAGVVTAMTLNGAQISSAIDVLARLKTGELSRIAGIEMLVAVGIQRDKVDAIVDSMGLMKVFKADASMAAFNQAQRDITEKTIFDEIKPVFDKMAASAVAASSAIKKASSEEVIAASINKETKSLIDAIAKGLTKSQAAAFDAQFKRVAGRNVLAPEQKRSIIASMQKNIEQWAKVSGESTIETMKVRLETLLASGVTDKTPHEDIVNGIREIFHGTDREAYPWANMIARTQGGMAQNSAAKEANKAAGYTHKEWVSGGGADGRPQHNKMNGVVVKMDEKFTLPDGTKMDFPGDPSAPVGHLANCRCTIVGTDNPNGSRG